MTATAVWASVSLGQLVDCPGVMVDHRATLQETIDVMARLGIGLVIVTQNGSIVGVVSERDLVWAISNRADLSLVWAADVMTQEPLIVPAETTLAEAAISMATGSHRHLLVADTFGVGVVSATDLIAELAMHVTLTD